ncbi:MAG: hypothetical protein H7Z41_15265 [Cytophagales bacterium]|nr:hypothetical protein [Armatimonadota bacterium]
MNPWIAVALAMASGGLFAVALPPFDQEWLGWLALAPLLLAVTVPKRRTLHALGLGLLTGIVAGIAQVGWANDATSLNFAYLPFIWIGLVFGGVGALAGAARQRWPGAHPLAWTLFTACAGVSVEWLTTLSPLPVGIALCQWRAQAFLQIASLTGIWGVSFLLWLVNAALADLALRRKPLTVPLTAAVLLTLSVGIWGAFRATNSARSDDGPFATLAAVQDYNGIDGGDPNGMRSGGGDVPDIETLMRQAADRGAELVVGSEEALGSAFVPNDDRDHIAHLAREKKRHFVVGYQQRGTSDKDFNCAALVGPTGKTLGVHRKVHLFLGEKNAIEAGQGATVVESGNPRLGKIGLLICFDTCWTGLTRAAAARGARIIAVPNYDPPVHHATLHHLHAALMPFRAVENGVALVRADPNGLSMVVDPWGKIAVSAPMYQAKTVAATVPLATGRGTFFTRWGDWLAYGCAGVVALAAAAGVVGAAAASPKP